MMSETIFRVGFTGHQQLGDEATVTFVSQQLRELLTVYQQQASQRGQGMLASSCLAPGSDQLFIKTALDLNIPVEAIIPCAQYEEIFTSAEAQYDELMLICSSLPHLQEALDDLGDSLTIQPTNESVEQARSQLQTRIVRFREMSTVSHLS